MGSKILTDLSIRLSTQTAELQKGVDNANRSLRTIQTNTDNISGRVSAGIAKIGGAFMAIQGGVEVFKKAINSTDASADNWEANAAGMEGAINGFFRTLYAGDFTNFITNMKRSALAMRELKVAQQEFEDSSASHSITVAKQQIILEEARLNAAETTNKELKAQYIQTALDAQKTINGIRAEESKTQVAMSEDTFRKLLEGNDAYKDKAIAAFRTIAQQWDYYFGENAMGGLDMINAQISNLKYKASATLGGLSGGDKALLSQLEDMSNYLEDFIGLQDGLEPEFMNNYRKTLAEMFSTVAQGDADLVKLQKSLTNVNAAIEKATGGGKQKGAAIIQRAEGISTASTSGIALPSFDVNLEQKLASAPAKAQTQWEALNETFKKSNYLTESIATSLDGIGDAFEGVFSKSKGALKGIVTAVLEAGKKIINVFLAEAIAGVIAGESKKGLLGIATAAVGIGILTALWKAKVPEFANGGLVYSPTNALVGEYPGASRDPEVIAPLSKLKSILGSSGMGGGTTVDRWEIDGFKLVALAEKVNRFNRSF